MHTWCIHGPEAQAQPKAVSPTRSMLAKDRGDVSTEELMRQGAANYNAVLLPVRRSPPWNV